MKYPRYSSDHINVLRLNSTEKLQKELTGVETNHAEIINQTFSSMSQFCLDARQVRSQEKRNWKQISFPLEISKLKKKFFEPSF
jgi:hypothetical protein